jgi:hypothetical protein
MPNNTAIMISFAACFAFYLSSISSSSNMSLAPSIRRLIEESADVLERIGSNPPHRNGTSALYGRHLREVVGTTPGTTHISQEGTQQRPLQAAYPPMQQNAPPMQMYQRQDVMDQLLQFSAMSDDQINETINNAGDELEMFLPELRMDDKTGLDWLDWFNMDVNG